MASEIDPKSAGELAENVKLTGKYAEEALDAFQKQLKVITQMRDAMEEISKVMQALCQQDCKALNPDTWKKVTKEVLKNDAATKNVSKTFKEVSTTSAKFAKALIFTAGALSSLKQGFSNVLALGKGIFGFFTSVAGGIFEIGKSILSIPFKMMSGLFKMASAGGSNELLEALEDVRETFGDLKSESSQAIIGVAKDIDKMNESGVPSYLIFGNLAGRIKAVREMAEGMGSAFQVFQDEVRDNGTAMMLYNRGLGITNEQMAQIASQAMRMGTGIAKVQNEMTKQALGMSKAFGVNAKVISRDMGKAMADLAHFGHLSTKEMAVAATFANKLGVSVDKLTAIMDQTATYDQAAEGMSKLNEQYGTNIDATEIMMAQNPAEKVELLRKAFAATGKDMSRLTYQDRMFIKQQTGMSDELMNSAFAAKNAGVSLDKMKTEAERAEKATLSQTEAIKALGDSIKRTFPSGGGAGGGVMDHFIDGFFRGIQSSKEFIGMMMNIKQVLREATIYGVQLGRKFVDMFPGVSQVFGGIRDFFDPSRFRKLFEGIIRAFDSFMKTGSNNIEDFMNNLQKTFFDFFNAGKEPGQRILGGLSKFGEAFFKILSGIASWAWGKLKDLYGSFVKELQDPGPLTRSIMHSISEAIRVLSSFIMTSVTPFLVSAVTALTSWLSGDELKNAMPGKSKLVNSLGEMFQPLGIALSDAAEKLYPVLKDLTVKIVVKIKDFLWQSFKEMTWQDKLMLGLTTFGPALGNAAIGIAGSALKSRQFETKMQEQITDAVTRISQAAGQQATSSVANAAAGAASQSTSVFAAAGTTLGATLATGIGTAIVASYAAYKFDEYLVDSYKERLKNVGEANDDFFKKLNIIKDESVEEKLKLVQEEIDRNEKIIKENDPVTASTARFWANWWAGDPDAIANAARQSLKAVKSVEQQVLDQKKRDTEAAEKKAKDEALARQQGTTQWLAAREAERSKEIAAQQAKALKDLGPVTIENAAERFKKIDDLSKKVMSKDFDIQDKIDQVRKKIGEVNFFIIDPTKQEEINKSLLALKSVQDIMTSIADIGGTTKIAGDRLASLSSTFKAGTPAYKELTSEGNMFGAINAAKETFSKLNYEAVGTAATNADKSLTLFDKMKNVADAALSYSNKTQQISSSTISEGLGKSLKAIQDMVASVQKMDDALSKLDKIDIGARLTAVAGSVGLGKSGNFTVKSKDVVINVSFNVTMDAHEIEKVMIGNKKSIIRDRINFALDRGAKGDNDTKSALIKSNPEANASYFGSNIPNSN